MDIAVILEKDKEHWLDIEDGKYFVYLNQDKLSLNDSDIATYLIPIIDIIKPLNRLVCVDWEAKDIYQKNTRKNYYNYPLSSLTPVKESPMDSIYVIPLNGIAIDSCNGFIYKKTQEDDLVTLKRDAAEYVNDIIKTNSSWGLIFPNYMYNSDVIYNRVIPTIKQTGADQRFRDEYFGSLKNNDITKGIVEFRPYPSDGSGEGTRVDIGSTLFYNDNPDWLYYLTNGINTTFTVGTAGTNVAIPNISKAIYNDNNLFYNFKKNNDNTETSIIYDPFVEDIQELRHIKDITGIKELITKHGSITSNKDIQDLRSKELIGKPASGLVVASILKDAYTTTLQRKYKINGIYHILGINWGSRSSINDEKIKTIPLIRNYYSAIIQNMIEICKNDVETYCLVLQPIPGQIFGGTVETEIGMYLAIQDNLLSIKENCHQRLRLILGINVNASP